LERTGTQLEFEGYAQEIVGVIQGVIVLCVVIGFRPGRSGFRRRRFVTFAPRADVRIDGCHSGTPDRLAG
ncbi:hypothetical protein AB0K09_33650, partial [Streptomyces sp. NPDC049577]